MAVGEPAVVVKAAKKCRVPCKVVKAVVKVIRITFKPAIVGNWVLFKVATAPLALAA